jgi:hypothetical protein
MSRTVEEGFYVNGRHYTLPRACPSGFKPQSRRAPPLVFYTSCSEGCVCGFWWFPRFELHVYSSMWSEAESLSEYGVVPKQSIYHNVYYNVYNENNRLWPAQAGLNGWILQE